MTNRYDKYIDFEFSYSDEEGLNNMVYTGYEDANNLHCCKCEKPLRKGHFFTGSENEEQWVFGTECVKWVFGAGLRKMRSKK